MGGGNKELAQEVGALIEPLSTVRELAPQANRLEMLEKNGEKQIANFERPIMKNLPFIVPPLVFIGFFGFALAGGGGIEGGLGIGLFMGISALIAIIVIKTKISSSYKTNTARLETVTEALNQANAELQGKDIDLIPPNRRDRQSMNFIYDALINQRAMNVQEAINLYEDQKYKNQMADIEQKKIQEIQRLNRSVQASNRKKRR